MTSSRPLLKTTVLMALTNSPFAPILVSVILIEIEVGGDHHARSCEGRNDDVGEVRAQARSHHCMMEK